jgi:hypothetical protein
MFRGSKAIGRVLAAGVALSIGSPGAAVAEARCQTVDGITACVERGAGASRISVSGCPRTPQDLVTNFHQVLYGRSMLVARQGDVIVPSTA